MSAELVSRLLSYLYMLPCVLIAITFHEAAHGYTAYRLGDPTAKALGRLTLNPLKHLDPIGALCMLLFRFGWAKPVPVNSRYFKKPRRDMALVAIAGPLTNVLLALIGVILYRLCGSLFSAYTAPQGSFALSAQYTVLTLLSYFFSLNASFAVFNLLPIPPLDGSRILSIFLPANLYAALAKYERYISLALLVLLWLGILDGPLSFLVNALLNGMFRITAFLSF